MLRVEDLWGSGFPFDVPAVAHIESLRLDTPITLLAGDASSTSRTSSTAARRTRPTCRCTATPRCTSNRRQSFLALAANRFGGEGFYVLDEPEAALSVSGALALLAIVVRAARSGAQFIIATHSPILLACPDAHIYELDDNGLARCAYDDLDAVRFTRGFLEAPDRFTRAALEDPDAE